MSTSFSIATEAELNAALAQIDVTGSSSAINTSYTITLTSSFTLTSELDAINLASGDTLSIVGNGNTIDGGGTEQGLFDYAGTVSISDLAINDTQAKGGTGSGGGAGLGGGLFVASAGTVTLNGVTFSGDSAIGGNAGGVGEDFSGGGGLDGGNGGSLGGGGGVGVSASGGSSNAGSGGGGIILGAAGGGAGSSGAGGGNGGGGGAGRFETSNTGAGGGGGGGGVGGLAGAAASGVNGGNGGGGGFGGGGGWGGDGAEAEPGAIAGHGGAGGFGGGGGAAGGAAAGSGGSVGGAGGFGGGGGLSQKLEAAAAGGFGGGNGAAEGGGGGGLGAGGDVFVQQGGALVIEGGTLGAGTVSGGAGYNGGGNGSAFGSGLFIQGSQSVTLDAPSGQTQLVAGAIADEPGSVSGYTQDGYGTVVIAGSGTVELTGADTYLGGTTLQDGATLQVGNGTIGSVEGPVAFPSDPATMRLDGTAAIDGLGTVQSFAPGDLIELVGDTFTTANLSYNSATEQLTIDATGSFPGSFTLDFSGLPSDAQFSAVPESDGTGIEMAITQPITLAGTAVGAETIGHVETIDPFTNVVITDPNSGQTETATITLSSPTAGALSLAGSYTGGLALTPEGSGTYELAAGGAAAEASAIDALVFTPNASLATTSFDLTVTDTAGESGSLDSGLVTIDPGPTITAVTPSIVEQGQSTEIGTVTPGLIGDMLTLATTGNTIGGSLSLDTANDEVFYIAPSSIPASTSGTVSYSVHDQYGDVAPAATAAITLDSGPVLIPEAPSASTLSSQKPIAVGLIRPGLSADTLTLTVLSAPKDGSVSLVGDQVEYTLATSSPPSTPDSFTYRVSDNHGGTTPGGTAIIGGNGSYKETGSSTGYTSVILGNGADTVALSGNWNAVNLGNGSDSVSGGTGNATVTVGNGIDHITLGGSDNDIIGGAGADIVAAGASGNTITLGNGLDAVSATGGNNTITLGNGADFVTVGGQDNQISLGTGLDIVQGGTDDTIRLTGNLGYLSVSGQNEMVFLGSGSYAVTDKGHGLELNIGPTAGQDVLTNFASDLSSGVIDLLGGVGGYTTAAQAYAALKSDGHGGVYLPLGHTGSLDIAGVTAKQLSANNFHIG